MKQTLIYFLLLISTTIVAQNAVAELKFEEAETAFNNGNYELTVQKVDEFEKIFGSMTDKSLYLRVVSQNKLFVPTNFYIDEKQFVLYNSLTANANKYIKATESNGLDDKFKEIYIISENLKKLNLPKDKVVWQKEKQRIEKTEQEKQKAILAQKEQCSKIFDELTIDNLPFGITIEEFQKQFPNVLGKNPKKTTNKYFITYSQNISHNKKYEFFMEKFEETENNIIVYTDSQNENKIYGYLKMIYFYSGKENKQSEYNSNKNNIFEKYKYLIDCAKQDITDGEFSVNYNDKSFLITSRILESTVYQIFITVGKKL